MYVGILYTQICIVIRTLPVSDSVSVIESATREIVFAQRIGTIQPISVGEIMYCDWALS
jgi:hypothetical protein